MHLHTQCLFFHSFGWGQYIFLLFRCFHLSSDIMNFSNKRNEITKHFIFRNLLLFSSSRIKAEVWQHFIFIKYLEILQRHGFSVFAPLIISPCLLLYLSTNYCFHSVWWKGWGCIFKQPGAINNLHTLSTHNMCVPFLPKSACSQLTTIKTRWKRPLQRICSTFLLTVFQPGKHK